LRRNAGSAAAESLRWNAERGVELARKVLKRDEGGQLDDGVLVEMPFQPGHKRLVRLAARAGHRLGVGERRFLPLTE